MSQTPWSKLDAWYDFVPSKAEGQEDQNHSNPARWDPYSSELMRGGRTLSVRSFSTSFFILLNMNGLSIM